MGEKEGQEGPAGPHDAVIDLLAFYCEVIFPSAFVRYFF